MKRLLRAIKSPKRVCLALIETPLGRLLSDKLYLKIKFRLIIGKKLDLKNPRTFNEKLQWLKLYNRNPEYTTYVDKFKVRDYIKEVLGEEYLVPLIGVWDDPEDIDFDALPDKFVLKCNHNSGLGMCICKDKSKLDIEKVKSDLKKGLKQNYYIHGREWPYKNVERKIICEKYMEDRSGELTDYKFLCFGGEVKCCFVCSDRFSDERMHMTFFDNDWNVMPFERHYPASTNVVPRPVNFEKMKKIAAELSKDMTFIRVDFYEVNGQIYFGELTFFPGGGFEEFTPEEWDYTLGSWIKI